MLAQVVESNLLVQMLIMAMIVSGVVEIVVVAMRQKGATVSPWFVRIAWIVVTVIVVIIAIKTILSVV